MCACVCTPLHVSFVCVCVCRVTLVCMEMLGYLGRMVPLGILGNQEKLVTREVRSVT